MQDKRKNYNIMLAEEDSSDLVDLPNLLDDSDFSKLAHYAMRKRNAFPSKPFNIEQPAEKPKNTFDVKLVKKTNNENVLPDQGGPSNAIITKPFTINLGRRSLKDVFDKMGTPSSLERTLNFSNFNSNLPVSHSTPFIKELPLNNLASMQPSVQNEIQSVPTPGLAIHINVNNPTRTNDQSVSGIETLQTDNVRTTVDLDTTPHQAILPSKDMGRALQTTDVRTFSPNVVRTPSRQIVFPTPSPHVSHRSHVVSHLSPVVINRSPVTSHRSPIIGDRSPSQIIRSPVFNNLVRSKIPIPQSPLSTRPEGFSTPKSRTPNRTHLARSANKTPKERFLDLLQEKCNKQSTAQTIKPTETLVEGHTVPTSAAPLRHEITLNVVVDPQRVHQPTDDTPVLKVLSKSSNVKPSPDIRVFKNHFANTVTEDIIHDNSPRTSQMLQNTILSQHFKSSDDTLRTIMPPPKRTKRTKPINPDVLGMEKLERTVLNHRSTNDRRNLYSKGDSLSEADENDILNQARHKKTPTKKDNRKLQVVEDSSKTDLSKQFNKFRSIDNKNVERTSRNQRNKASGTNQRKSRQQSSKTSTSQMHDDSLLTSDESGSENAPLSILRQTPVKLNLRYSDGKKSPQVVTQRTTDESSESSEEDIIDTLRRSINISQQSSQPKYSQEDLEIQKATAFKANRQLRRSNALPSHEIKKNHIQQQNPDRKSTRKIKSKKSETPQNAPSSSSESEEDHETAAFKARNKLRRTNEENQSEEKSKAKSKTNPKVESSEDYRPKTSKHHKDVSSENKLTKRRANNHDPEIISESNDDGHIKSSKSSGIKKKKSPTRAVIKSSASERRSSSHNPMLNKASKTINQTTNMSLISPKAVGTPSKSTGKVVIRNSKTQTIYGSCDVDETIVETQQHPSEDVSVQHASDFGEFSNPLVMSQSSNMSLNIRTSHRMSTPRHLKRTSKQRDSTHSESSSSESEQRCNAPAKKQKTINSQYYDMEVGVKSERSVSDCEIPETQCSQNASMSNTLVDNLVLIDNESSNIIIQKPATLKRTKKNKPDREISPHDSGKDIHRSPEQENIHKRAKDANITSFHAEETRNRKQAQKRNFHKDSESDVESISSPRTKASARSKQRVLSPKSKKRRSTLEENSDDSDSNETEQSKPDGTKKYHQNPKRQKSKPQVTAKTTRGESDTQRPHLAAKSKLHKENMKSKKQHQTQDDPVISHDDSYVPETQQPETDEQIKYTAKSKQHLKMKTAKKERIIPHKHADTTQVDSDVPETQQSQRVKKSSKMMSKNHPILQKSKQHKPGRENHKNRADKSDGEESEMTEHHSDEEDTETTQHSVQNSDQEETVNIRVVQSINRSSKTKKPIEISKNRNHPILKNSKQHKHVQENHTNYGHSSESEDSQMTEQHSDEEDNQTTQRSVQNSESEETLNYSRQSNHTSSDSEQEEIDGELSRQENESGVYDTQLTEKLELSSEPNINDNSEFSIEKPKVRSPKPSGLISSTSVKSKKKKTNTMLKNTKATVAVDLGSIHEESRFSDTQQSDQSVQHPEIENHSLPNRNAPESKLDDVPKTPKSHIKTNYSRGSNAKMANENTVSESTFVSCGSPSQSSEEETNNPTVPRVSKLRKPRQPKTWRNANYIAMTKRNFEIYCVPQSYRPKIHDSPVDPCLRRSSRVKREPIKYWKNTIEPKSPVIVYFGKPEKVLVKDRAAKKRVNTESAHENTNSVAGTSGMSRESSNQSFAFISDLYTGLIKTDPKNVALMRFHEDMAISTKDGMTRLQKNGVEYWYYSTQLDISRGFMKFSVNGYKKRCTTSEVLEIVVFSGTLTVTYNQDVVNIAEGDFIRLQEGTKYSLTNNTGGIVLAYFSKTSST